MLGETVAVHQHHGHRPQSPVIGGRQRRPGRVFVQGAQNVALRPHPFVHFDDLGIQHFRQGDGAGEQIRAVLLADAQTIGETGGDHQQSGFAVTFQQGVGGHRGAHLHRRHLFGRNRIGGRQPQEAADAGQGRVLVLFRVFRQQLQRRQNTVRFPGDDVGESAAAVDPELPAAHGNSQAKEE